MKSTKDFRYDNQSYINIFRYLSLVLSGQVQKGTFDSYEWSKMTLDVQKRFNPPESKNPEKFKELLKEILNEAAYL